MGERPNLDLRLRLSTQDLHNQLLACTCNGHSLATEVVLSTLKFPVNMYQLIKQTTPT